MIEVRLDAEGRPLRYDFRFRGWSPRGFWFDDGSLYRESHGGRLTWRIAGPPSAPEIRPQVRDVFVGRGGDFCLVEMAAEEEVHVIPQEPAGVGGVGQVVERVVDQNEAIAWELVTALCAEEADLILGEEEVVGILVVPAEPGGVEADEVEVERVAREAQGLPVAEVRMERGIGEEVGAADCGQPAPVVGLASEELFALRLSKSAIEVLAGHPPGGVETGEVQSRRAASPQSAASPVKQTRSIGPSF